VNNNIIYTIKYKAPSKDRGESNQDFCPGQNFWMDKTLSRMQEHAEQINADLRVLTEEDASNIDLPLQFTHYQIACFLKLIGFNEFCNSLYDNMFYVDLDVWVNNLDYNIFSHCEAPGVYLQKGGNKAMVQKNRILLREKFKLPLLDGVNYNYCWGSFLIDRDTAKLLNRYLPRPNEWTEFFTKYNLINNDKIYVKNTTKLVIDQDIFSQSLVRNDILNPNPLPSFSVTTPNNPRNSEYAFIHYCGEEGKEYLRGLS